MWHVGHLCVCLVHTSRLPVMSNTRGKTSFLRCSLPFVALCGVMLANGAFSIP